MRFHVLAVIVLVLQIVIRVKGAEIDEQDKVGVWGHVIKYPTITWSATCPTVLPASASIQVRNAASVTILTVITNSSGVITGVSPTTETLSNCGDYDFSGHSPGDTWTKYDRAATATGTSGVTASGGSLIRMNWTRVTTPATDPGCTPGNYSLPLTVTLAWSGAPTPTPSPSPTVTPTATPSPTVSPSPTATPCNCLDAEKITDVVNFGVGWIAYLAGFITVGGLFLLRIRL